jgi:uncharacterized protein (TIGR03435 family)
MVRGIACVVLCASGLVYGQAGAPEQFEVASIKPSNADPRSSSGIQAGHGRLTASNVTVKRCIMGAYGVGLHQILGGPDWLDSDRFDILAKSEQPVGDHALMAMLQSLLAERFKLTLHRETRMIPAFVLEVAKGGAKLEKAEGGEASTQASTTNAASEIAARNTSMDLLARVLARAREIDLPVENLTGLDGLFNFRLQWTPESTKPASPAEGRATEGPSLFTAIEEQLGLRLRAQKAPVQVLVIDHAERPTEN